MVMQLKTFVAQTLVEVMQGVKDAQAQAKELGGYINIGQYTLQNGSLPIQAIEFDVAVTVTSGKETSGGIGVYVPALALGSKGKSESNHESVSRIKFTVPVVLPPPMDKMPKSQPVQVIQND